eukprot:9545938-Alexandrium_andersonii.AAC.1
MIDRGKYVQSQFGAGGAEGLGYSGESSVQANAFDGRRALDYDLLDGTPGIGTIIQPERVLRPSPLEAEREQQAEEGPTEC